MENLIITDDFSKNGPITFDNFKINNKSVYSATILENSTPSSANFKYNVPILSQNNKEIIWGIYIRAIEITIIELCVDFYDESNNLIDSTKQDMTKYITRNFNNIYALFNIPETTANLNLSLHFKDKTTACTFYSPFAYFRK